MDDKLKERVNKILDKITSQELLKNRGLGNDIGFYIFDYPPDAELEMREQVEYILNAARKRNPDIKIAHVNLFKLIVDYLRNRGLLDRAIKLQAEKGDAELAKALKGPLHEEKIAKEFVAVANPMDYDLVVVTGVGNCWPLMRSHTLLNNLHPLMKCKPLVVFYPGVYDGQGLNLFGKVQDNNYYRAFRLIPIS